MMNEAVRDFYTVFAELNMNMIKIDDELIDCSCPDGSGNFMDYVPMKIYIDNYDLLPQLTIQQLVNNFHKYSKKQQFSKVWLVYANMLDKEKVGPVLNMVYRKLDKK